MKYAGRWDALPVDSHELVAMVAPRPVVPQRGQRARPNPDGSLKMMTAGNPGFQASRGPIEQQAANINDAWVDAEGHVPRGRRRRTVYRLLGKKDLGTTEFPAIETALTSGDIASASTPPATHRARTGRCSSTSPRSTSTRRQPGRGPRRKRASRWVGARKGRTESPLTAGCRLRAAASEAKRRIGRGGGAPRQ